jgi:hypothetical protein
MDHWQIHIQPSLYGRAAAGNHEAQAGGLNSEAGEREKVKAFNKKGCPNKMNKAAKIEIR